MAVWDPPENIKLGRRGPWAELGLRRRAIQTGNPRAMGRRNSECIRFPTGASPCPMLVGILTSAEPQFEDGSVYRQKRPT